jgi:hypothetical protein
MCGIQVTCVVGALILEKRDGEMPLTAVRVISRYEETGSTAKGLLDVLYVLYVHTCLRMDDIPGL